MTTNRQQLIDFLLRRKFGSLAPAPPPTLDLASDRRLPGQIGCWGYYLGAWGLEAATPRLRATPKKNGHTARRLRLAPPRGADDLLTEPPAGAKRVPVAFLVNRQPVSFYISTKRSGGTYGC